MTKTCKVCGAEFEAVPPPPDVRSSAPTAGKQPEKSISGSIDSSIISAKRQRRKAPISAMRRSSRHMNCHK